MHNNSIVISLFLLSAVSLYGADERFISKEQEIKYLYDGDFKSNYSRKKITTQAEAQQLEQLRGEVEGTANHLKRLLADLIAKNTHVMIAFPAEGPTIKMQLKIMMNEIPGSKELSADQRFEYSGYKFKGNRSQDEESDCAQIRSSLKRIALQGCDTLISLLDNYQNIIGFHENSCAIGLDLDLYMRRVE